MSQQGEKNRGERRGPLRRYGLWIAGAAVLVTLVAMILRPKVQAVDFATVERGPLLVSLDEEGETRVRDRYVVSAPLAGRVLRIELEPGDPVMAKESVLATFQPSAPVLLDARSRAETEAQVRAAEATLGQAKAERERALAEQRFAEAELTRRQRLADDQIISKESLESAELQLDTRRQAAKASDFRVRTVQNDLAMLKVRLQDMDGEGDGADSRQPIAIRSPVDGVVLRRLRESESQVQAGEPLLEVADPSRLEIVSDFLSTDAVRIRPGQGVLIEQWGGDGVLRGTVRRVEPSGFTKISALGVEEQRVNVIIDLEDPRSAWDALGDGFRVEVRVIIWQGDDVLQVPTSALFRHGEGWAVFAEQAGKAALVEVQVGQRNALAAQIIDGLEAGSRVIVHPADSIEDGVAVSERDLG